MMTLSFEPWGMNSSASLAAVSGLEMLKRSRVSKVLGKASFHLLPTGNGGKLNALVESVRQARRAQAT
jgi:hypothetical protein